MAERTKFKNDSVLTAFRLDSKDLRLIDRAATQAGRNRSQLIRIAVISAAKTILGEQPVNSVP